MNLTRFIKNNYGVAAVEFALLMPILLILFLGGFEMTRYILLYQKISKTASSMSDLISRSPSVTEDYFISTYSAVPHLLSPYYDAGKIRVTISSVQKVSGVDRVRWQRCGGGSLIATSKIGAVGDVAVLPNGFSLEASEDTVIVEVFYDFKPMIAPDVLAPDIVYKARFTKPRLGALVQIIGDSGATGC